MCKTSVRIYPTEGAQTGCCDNLEGGGIGWEGGIREGTYLWLIHFRCVIKTYTIFLSSYPSIKFFKKENVWLNIIKIILDNMLILIVNLT